MDDRKLLGSGSVKNLGHTTDLNSINEVPVPSTAKSSGRELSPGQASGDHSPPPIMNDNEAPRLVRSGRYRSRYRDATGLVDTTKVGPYNARQRIVLREELEDGKVVYPSELIPHAAHPLIRDAIAANPLLMRRIQHDSLDWFNWFTSHLEHRFVNPVLLDLKEGSNGLSLPDMMRLDASVIHWEESGHAHVADELSYEIGKATCEPSKPQPRPEFYDRISRIEGCVPADLRPLVRLLFVVGTETSITGVLSKLPRHEGVVTAVRAVIRDHAADEARHSSYFTDVFEYVFPLLPSRARRTIGPLLPEIVGAFLEPDRRSVRHQLMALGFRPEETDLVVWESYPQIGIRAAIADSAAGTLALFRRHGVFKDPETLDAFYRSGLTKASDIE